MFFNKIEGEIPNNANRKARKTDARKIAIRTTEFNQRTGDTCCFVSTISDEIATFCIITKCSIDPKTLVKNLPLSLASLCCPRLRAKLR